VAALLLVSSQIAAAERKLTGSEIASQLSGHTYQATENGRKVEQIFHEGGATFYTVEGSQSQGLWRTTSDQYCSQWPPSEAWTCYDVVQDGSAITFISSSGTRYPMARVN
jgi:hypothetical protein